MTSTGKNRKKYDGVRALAVKQLAQKYKVSDSFVRQSVRGDRESETALQIRSEFNTLYNALTQALKKQS